MKNNKKNMMQNKPLPSSNPQIPWHPAFVEALQLELEAYKDVLEFHPELQLTTEPLRIDCVVIKKKKEVKIEKNIGVIFRTWNLIEYKSPDDYVSVDDFYKVYGYACIYTFLNKIPITDLTITFVESHYPEKLIEHLKTIRGYTVAKTSAGIYTVKGDILPIQIIDSRKLSAEDNVWLKNLSKSLNRSDVELISVKIAQRGKTARIDAYAYAIAHANIKIIKERFMKTKSQSEYKQLLAQLLLQLFEETGTTEILKEEYQKQKRQELEELIADKDAEIASLRAQLESKS